MLQGPVQGCCLRKRPNAGSVGLILGRFWPLVPTSQALFRRSTNIAGEPCYRGNPSAQLPPDESHPFRLFAVCWSEKGPENGVREPSLT